MDEYLMRGYDALIYAYMGRPLDDYHIIEARLKDNPIDLDLSVPCGCLNNCSYCGYQERLGNKMTQDHIFRLIDEFADMGAHSIRIVGQGEPFLRNDLLAILARINQNSLVPVVFTCGDVLGNNELAKRIHNLESGELVRALLDLNVTLMMKYDTLKDVDKITRRCGYTEMRNRALSLIMDAGFNRYNPTRLGFGVVITDINIRELPEIYDFALYNNIYFLGCYLMPIGKVEEKEKRDAIKPSVDDVMEVTAILYKIAFEYGVRELFGIELCTPSDIFPKGFRIAFKGPFDFAGSRKCAIATSGFFVDCTGEIKFCETLPAVGRFPKMKLGDAWKRMAPLEDRQYSACRSVGRCQAKREAGVIPPGFDSEIKRKVQDYIDQNQVKWGTRSIDPKLRAFFNKHPERLLPKKLQCF